MNAAALALCRREAPLAARFRVGLTYLWRHGRFADLNTPTRFTELVQLRKLHDRDPRLPLLADKVRAKAFVARTLGKDWVIPSIWEGTALPDAPDWPRPFVVKARHGCTWTRFVRDACDWSSLRELTARWCSQRYGGWLDEWLYGEIERGLLIEPMIGDGVTLPLDYKFYVFGGRVAFVQVHLDRESAHRWVVLDRDWRAVAPTAPAVSRPATLARMIAAAETLARGFDFVRVDLYDVGARPLFGEMTFYPGSGLDPFDPPELDLVMGSLWLTALKGGWDHAASGIRASAHIDQHSLSASVSRSMSSSVCTGDGVIRSRSVPLGTVG